MKLTLLLALGLSFATATSTLSASTISLADTAVEFAHECSAMKEQISQLDLSTLSETEKETLAAVGPALSKICSSIDAAEVSALVQVADGFDLSNPTADIGSTITDASKEALGDTGSKLVGDLSQSLIGAGTDALGNTLNTELGPAYTLTTDLVKLIGRLDGWVKEGF